MQRRVGGSTLHANKRGFTIVELCVVIIVASILIAIGGGMIMDYRLKSRDGERVADIEVMARSLERQYRTQASAVGATYPPTTVGAAGLSLLLSDNQAAIAPDETENSIVIATSASTQRPDINEYIYQPLNVDDSLCTSAPCARYKLVYRLEENETVVTKESMRQQ